MEISQNVVEAQNNNNGDDEIQTIYARVPSLGIFYQSESSSRQNSSHVQTQPIQVVRRLSDEEKAALEYSTKRKVVISSMKQLWESTFEKWSAFYGINIMPSEIEECFQLMSLKNNQKISHEQWEVFQNSIHLRMKVFSRFDALCGVELLPHRVLARSLLMYLQAMYANNFDGENVGEERLWAYKTAELLKIVNEYIKFHSFAGMRVFSILSDN